jgi:hypothetical protein
MAVFVASIFHWHATTTRIDGGIPMSRLQNQHFYAKACWRGTDGASCAQPAITQSRSTAPVVAVKDQNLARRPADCGSHVCCEFVFSYPDR